MKKRFTMIAAALWALALVAVVSSTVTLLATGTVSADSRPITDEELELLERYSRLEEVRQTLTKEYYTEPDQDVLIQGAIDGMLSSLDDPYTFYYTVEEMEDSKESMSGQYKGVGMSVQMNMEGAINIIRVFKDSPAYFAGVQAGDVLVAIDGDMLDIQTYEDLTDAVDRMRGVEGTEVTLTVIRKDESLDFTMERAAVNINYVEYELIDDIGYVRVYEFEQSTADEFAKALAYFKEQNVRGVIADFRSNPGGLLDAAVKVLDQLLPAGRILYTEDRAGNISSYYSSNNYWDIPLVTMADANSASASEIVCGALQDMDRATMVGTKSFGKGIVQRMVYYDDGSGMQYTEARYYLPSGRCIHGEGLYPDVEVEMQESYDPSIYEVDLNNDNQLAEALEVLRDEIDGGLEKAE